MATLSQLPDPVKPRGEVHATARYRLPTRRRGRRVHAGCDEIRAVLAAGNGGGGAGEHMRTRSLSLLLVLACLAPVLRPAAARAGSFKVSCGYIASATMDPIVAPGISHFGHLHEFFGNPLVHASSNTDDPLVSTDSLFAAGHSTCLNQGDDTRDRSAYWIPALLQRQADGSMREVAPEGRPTFYYLGDASPSSSIRPFPHGLRMIVGDKNAAVPQDLAVVRWQCLGGVAVAPSRPQCLDDVTVAGTPRLRLQLNFPNCWDGKDTDTPDHKSHVARSDSARCPADHPVPIPRLQMLVTYPIAGGPDASMSPLPGAVALSSGGVFSMHGDFMNGWTDDSLADRVASCLQADVTCVDAPG